MFPRPPSTIAFQKGTVLATITLVLASTISAAIGASLAYLLTTNRDRTLMTLKLFEQFNEPDHHRARHRAALALTSADALPPTFNELWGEPESIQLYEDLWQIVYFWFEFEMLARRRLINRRLAQGLFAYPYRYWAPMLQRLARRHIAEADQSGELCPDWCAMWQECALSWIDRP